MDKLLIIIFSLTFSFSATAQTVNEAKPAGPVALILGKSGGEIAKEELLKADGISLSDGGKINEYTVVRGAKGKQPWEGRYSMCEFPESVRQIIKDLQPGNKLYFENIKSGNRKIPSIVFIIIK